MAEIDRVLHIRGLKSNCPVLLNGQIGIIEDQGQETLVFGTVAGNKYVPSGFDFNNFKQDILDMIGDTNSLITVNKVIVNAINELVNSGGVGSGSGGTVNYTTYTYTATADNTTSFSIVNNGIYDPTKDYIQLYLKGVMLTPDVDYIISDLDITLNTFTLNNSESIFMLIFKTEEMNGTNLVDGTVEKNKFETSVQVTLTNADKIGDLSTLETTVKDTIVGAINENSTSLAEMTQQIDSIGTHRPNNLGIAIVSHLDYNDYDTHFSKLSTLHSECELVVMISVNNNNDYNFNLQANSEITSAFDKALQYGVKISLVKIHLVKSFSLGWNTSLIKPDIANVSSWFANYEQALRDTIELIKSYGFNNTITIANENNGVFQDLTLTSNWQTLVNNLKTSYPDIKFGYSSDFSGIEWALNNKRNNANTMLDYLDFIAFNTYPVLNYQNAWDAAYDNNGGSKNDKKNILYAQSYIDYILELNRLYGKDVIISEVGCTGRDKSLRNPIDVTYPINTNIQGLYYDIMFQSIASIDAVLALYVWSAREPFNFYGTTGETTISDYFNGGVS